jgi:hypothetical protein
MSLELHEWDIHIVCFGTSGSRVTEVQLHVFRVPLPGPVGVGMIRVAHEAAGAVAVCAGNGLTR